MAPTPLSLSLPMVGTCCFPEPAMHLQPATGFSWHQSLCQWVSRRAPPHTHPFHTASFFKGIPQVVFCRLWHRSWTNYVKIYLLLNFRTRLWIRIRMSWWRGLGEPAQISEVGVSSPPQALHGPLGHSCYSTEVQLLHLTARWLKCVARCRYGWFCTETIALISLSPLSAHSLPSTELAPSTTLSRPETGRSEAAVSMCYVMATCPLFLINSHQGSKQKWSQEAQSTGSSRRKHHPRTVVCVCTHTLHRPQTIDQ